MAMFDAGVYMDTYADLQKAYNDMRKRGQLQAGTDWFLLRCLWQEPE